MCIRILKICLDVYACVYLFLLKRMHPNVCECTLLLIVRIRMCVCIRVRARLRITLLMHVKSFLNYQTRQETHKIPVNIRSTVHRTP